MGKESTPAPVKQPVFPTKPDRLGQPGKGSK
jgi:hypothetical protein